MRQHVRNMEIGANRALAVPAVAVFLGGHALFTIRDGGDPPGVDPHIRRHVERPTVAVVPVKAVDVGAVEDRPGEVDTAIGFGPVPPQVPLADHRGVVAGGLHQVAERGAVGRNQVFARAAEHAPGEPRPPVVAAGEQAVAGGGADGARGMGVEKGQAFIRHLLQAWRCDFAGRIRGRDVADAEIVCHHEDHIGSLLGCPSDGASQTAARGGQDQQKESASCRHGKGSWRRAR